MKKDLRIVFIGDSITDGGRDYRNYHQMGNSYPKYASELIAAAYPDINFEFINQGINGNRTGQISDRLCPDAINFKPDIVSVLAGINDIWHNYQTARVEVTDEQFAANYRAILSRLKEQTSAKLLVLFPYVLDHESKAHFIPDLERRLPVMRAIAAEYADATVSLNEEFADAMKTQPAPYYYSGDGVHPNAAGAEFIGKLYFEAVKPLIESVAEEK